MLSTRMFSTKINPRLTPKELMEHVRNTKMFDRVLNKVNIVSMENGNGLAEFTVANEHTNNFGYLNSGFSTMLVDFVSSYSFSSHPRGNNFHVSTHMNLKFLCPKVKIGDQIEVEAKTIRASHFAGILEVTLRNKESQKILAKAIHNLFILNDNKTDSAE